MPSSDRSGEAPQRKSAADEIMEKVVGSQKIIGVSVIVKRVFDMRTEQQTVRHSSSRRDQLSVTPPGLFASSDPPLRARSSVYR